VDHQPEGLFDTIESAHEYIKILAEVVSDVKKDLETASTAERAQSFHGGSMQSGWLRTCWINLGST
jgi:hypothetical protein